MIEASLHNCKLVRDFALSMLVCVDCVTSIVHLICDMHGCECP